MSFQEYRLARRSEITGLVVSLVAVILGFLLLFSSEHISISFDRFASIAVAVAFILIGGGIVAFIVFGMVAIFSYKGIVRFNGVKAIILTDKGIIFRRKASSSQLMLEWQNVRSVEYRGLKWFFMGLVETR